MREKSLGPHLIELEHRLQQKLQEFDSQGLRRRLISFTGREGCRISPEGGTCLNLSGNDYLGLAFDRQLAASFYGLLDEKTILERFGPGAAASRLMTGNPDLYSLVENRMAELYHRQCCLIFNSGYHGNTAILPTLSSKNDLILADRLCHASIIDGMQLARARCLRYPHLDYERLEQLLREQRSRYDQVFIVTESLFSMDGDLADLHILADLKRKYRAVLYVDEAHAVGVFGPRGLGLAEKQGLIGEIDLLFGTFGKALGGLGGFVLCSRIIGDYLINRARPLIYTTGLPPVCLNWLLFILERLPDMADERRRLLRLARDLRKDLAAAGLSTRGESQIVPVMVGDSFRTLAAAGRLREQGYWVTAVRPPTVPAGSARLRLSVTADMEAADLAPLPGRIREALA